MPTGCTREEVRELDRRAIEEYGMPPAVLMENAGAGAARVAVEMLGNPAGMRVAVFCGKGNNGGDGFVIARHLNNQGAKIDLVLACSPDEIPEDGEAGVNLAIVRAMELPIHAADTETDQLEALGVAKEADLLIDALLGTGLSGDVRDPYLALIRLVNAADSPILSIDLPSGLDANLGKTLRAAVRATCTATFVWPKRGFYLLDGPSHIGKVHVIDIGMPRELIESLWTTGSEEELGELPEISDEAVE
jgi:NAD(P)H-hydrate epimerase